MLDEKTGLPKVLQETFGTGFDELLVVAEGETVGFITQGHDREDLGHDEVRKLIEFLDEVLRLRAAA